LQNWSVEPTSGYRISVIFFTALNSPAVRRQK
jgi:hypothetical protein